MRGVILDAIWILVLNWIFMGDAIRPIDVTSRTIPNIIYQYENGSRIAMAGDTCNYDHRSVVNNNIEIDFSDFDAKCDSTSSCQFVLDKKGDPISLSVDSFFVKNYQLGRETVNLKTVIYFKKCMCPPDKFFSHSTATCTATATIQPQLYCEDAAILNTITFALLILCLTLAIGIGS